MVVKPKITCDRCGARRPWDRVIRFLQGDSWRVEISCPFHLGEVGPDP